MNKVIVWLREVFEEWHVYLEPVIPVPELIKNREAAAVPSFSFFLLLITASIIATLGLIANSVAVIIGAMIVAPLMNPILSIAFAIVTGNWKLYKRSFITIILGVITTLLVSYFISYFIGVPVVGSEILARTEPNLIDLGIAIAAGGAGAFTLTRASIANSIAGVAIAVALVPPICVSGIGLYVGIENNHYIALPAFVLFLTNLAGIIFAASVIFISQSYGSFKIAFKGIIHWLIVLIILSIPLGAYLESFIFTNEIRRGFYEIKETQFDPLNNVVVQNMDINLNKDTILVDLLITAPENTITQDNLKVTESLLQETIKKSLLTRFRRKKKLIINASIAPIKVIRLESEVNIK